MSRKTLITAAFTTLLAASPLLAQQPQTPTDPNATQVPGFRERRHDKLREPGFGRKRGLKERKFGVERSLNLTEEQRQQQRAIVQKHVAATRSQREQLFQLREKELAGTLTAEDQARAKALRQELRESMAGIRTETLSLLTAEQRTQLESMREQRKQRREEMMKQRQEMHRKRLPEN